MTEQDGANALHSSGEEANIDKIEEVEEKSEVLHDGEIHEAARKYINFIGYCHSLS